MACPSRLLKSGRTWFSPDVFVVDVAGQRYVFKDYGSKPWFGRLWGRTVIAREGQALRALEGIRGVPRFVGFVDRDGLLMEFCEGSPLIRRGVRGKIAPEFFDACLELLETIHARGVAHGDIRRKNILVTTDGAPVLIDFQTALRRNGSWWERRLWPLISQTDRWNLVHIKSRTFPEALTSWERSLLASPPIWLRWGRFLRRGLYRRLVPKRKGP